MAKPIILKNTTVGAIELTAFGLTILAGGSRDVSDIPSALLRNDSFLSSKILSGEIVVNDGTQDITAANGFNFPAEPQAYINNDVTFNPVFGGRGSINIPDGTTAQRTTPPLLGDTRFNNDIASSLVLEIYDGVQWVQLYDWDAIQADSGSIAPNAPNETLQILGTGGVTTSALGNTITIDASSIIGSLSDLASVTVSNTTPSAIPLTFSNVAWDTTHVENDTSIIEHDNTNTDRVLIKETGLYFIYFSISFDADAGEEQIDARVLVDDTTVVPGSLRTASEDDEVNDLSNAITAELTAGTYLTFQVQASGLGNVLHETTTFSVTRARGAKGDAGPTGAGSNIIVQNDDVTVGTVTATLNFEGTGVASAVDEGSNKTTITIDGSLVGTEYQRAESLGVSSTNSLVFQNKVTLNTTVLPAGTYRVAFIYGWNHNATDSDFEAEFLEDSSSMGEIHKQEPQDSAGVFGTTGTSQRYYENRVFHTTFVSAASHTYELNWRTDDGGDTSSIWEAIIELWRVE